MRAVLVGKRECGGSLAGFESCGHGYRIVAMRSRRLVGEREKKPVQGVEARGADVAQGTCLNGFGDGAVG